MFTNTVKRSRFGPLLRIIELPNRRNEASSMLALLLLAHQVFARDATKATYHIKSIDNCPEVGYFFKRDMVPNSLTPGPCFLCFCQNDGTAICWQRENSRCDVESYHRHHVGRRETAVSTNRFHPIEDFSRVTTVQENITDSLLNILVTTTENSMFNKTSLTKHSLNLTTMITNTIRNSEYYKYLINSSTTTTKTTTVDEIHNKSGIIDDRSVDNDKLTKTTDVNNIEILKDEEIIYLVDKLLSLKCSFRKWNHAKLRKNKAKHLKKEILFSKNNNRGHKPIIKNYEPNPKEISRKDIQNKIIKKYNLKKILNKNDFNRTHYKMSDVQSILKRLLKGKNNKNATTRIKPKTKRYKNNIFKIMKKLMKKIFTGKNKTRENVLRKTNKSINLSKQHIVKIICESMGPCKLGAGNRLWLKASIIELNAETNKILRIIKTIKGLLHLVDIPKKYIEEVATKNSKCIDDVNKLSIILKDSYIEENKMSATNILQIGYIKSYTQEFIKSFEKCVAILNEMITVLTANNINSKFSTKEKSFNKKHDNLTHSKYLPNLKSLFLRYNLLQNNFMRRMYQLLIDDENNSSKKNISNKVSHDRDLNKTIEIDDSRRFIKNLRKLKTLAQILNSSRKKREARNEDAMEYMLIMMDYLLKHNAPSNPAPVKDGIDLLIETIKRAPDIKTIKRSTLGNTPPAIIKITRTMKPTTSIIRDDKNRISNNEEVIFSSDDSKHNEIEENVENELVDLVAGIKTKTSNTDSLLNSVAEEMENVIKFTTEAVNEVKRKEYDNRNYEVVTDENLNISKAEKSDVYLIDDNSNDDKIEKHGNDRKSSVFSDQNLIVNTIEKPRFDIKYEGHVREDVKNDKVEKQDIYRNNRTHEVDEDENLNFKKPKYEEDVDQNLNINKVEKSGDYFEDRTYKVYIADNDYDIMPNETKIAVVRKVNPSKAEKITNEYKKSKLDWIENAYDKEMKAYNEATNGTTTPKPTRTKLVKHTKKENNISDISKEVADVFIKKNPKINTKEVKLKKQKHVLNSLDYGTEISDFDDPDSKDGPDSGESFSTYFV